MEININRRFFSEQDALKLLMEEMSKTEDRMDITLIRECLCFLYPENAEDDRAYIEKTLPVLHEKLGFGHRSRVVRRGKARMALAAVLVVMGVLLLASVVAYAFGVNVLNFFIYDTEEYWMIHTQTQKITEPVDADLSVPSGYYDVWGEAVVQGMTEMNVFPALPQIIPDGYAYVSRLNTGLDGLFAEETYTFANPDGQFFKLIVRSDYQGDIDSGRHVQKEIPSTEIVTHNGLGIVLAQNYDSVSATWISENCQVRLAGTCSMEELRMMIDSI